MIYTEKDTFQYLKFFSPQTRKKKSSNQNFQAETKDKLFSSLGVDLRVIILNSMLPFFSPHRGKNTLYQGLRVICPGSIFNHTDDILTIYTTTQ